MTLSSTIPALPVRDIARAVDCYTGAFGFSVLHLEGQGQGFAVVGRDAVEVHLWQAADDGWRQRPADDLADSPVRTGAEDFIAGTASCRIACSDLDALYADLARKGVLHPSDPGWPVDTAYGTREFHARDVDGNLLTFFVRLQDRPAR